MRLDLVVAEPTANLDGPACQPSGLREIVVGKQREMPLPDREQRVLRRRLEAVEEPLRAAEPATRDRPLAAHVLAAEAEPQSGARGAEPVAGLSVKGVRALERVYGRSLVVEP